MVTAMLREHVDRVLKKQNTFTYQSIEEAVRRFYLVGDEEPADEELLDMVGELHADYVQRRLAKPGE